MGQEVFKQPCMATVSKLSNENTLRRQTLTCHHDVVFVYRNSHYFILISRFFFFRELKNCSLIHIGISLWQQICQPISIKLALEISENIPEKRIIFHSCDSYPTITVPVVMRRENTLRTLPLLSVVTMRYGTSEVMHTVLLLSSRPSI